MFLFLALNLFLTDCALADSKKTVIPPVTLKVIVLPFMSFAPFFIAEEKGYFAEQGITIELVELNESSQAIPILAKGKIDVLGGAINLAMLNAIARGAKIKIIAAKGHIAPVGCVHFTLMARRVLLESGQLESATQLRGRCIAFDTNRASFLGYFLDKLLVKVNLGLDDVKIVEFPSYLNPKAFEKGSVDLAIAAEPWITRITRSGTAVSWKSAQEVVPNSDFGFVLFGPNLLEKSPDAGQRFMVAYLKGVRQYHQGKTEQNLNILAKRTKLDRELLTQVCWPPVRDDGKINVQSVLDFQAWAGKKGYIDKLVPPQQLWDSSFAEYAIKVLETSKN